MGKKEDLRFQQIEKAAAELAAKLDQEIAKVQKDAQTKLSVEIAGIRKTINERFEQSDNFDEWVKDALQKTTRSITEVATKLSVETDRIGLEHKASVEIASSKLEKSQIEVMHKFEEEAEKRHKVRRSFENFVELFKDLHIEETFAEEKRQVNELRETLTERVQSINGNLDEFRGRFAVMEGQIQQSMADVDAARVIL